jgi:hypothetical protein
MVAFPRGEMKVCPRHWLPWAAEFIRSTTIYSSTRAPVSDV